MNFSQIGLSAELLRALKEQGYQEATPIQQQAIPAILDGKDILAGAQTGTGKTAGFTLPILRRLQDAIPEPRHRRIRALILTPTRELAAQVGESVRTYGRHLPFRTAVVYGGVSINTQIAKFRKGVDIVVATPGRLLDHMRQGTVCLDHVDTLVLDEADRMLDMGFIKDIRWIIKSLPEKRQNLLFSATFSDEIRKLAARLLNNPAEIQVARKNSAVERVSQIVHPVDRTRKQALLSYLIGAGNWRQVLVFTRTKHGADRLAKQLIRDGLSATAIHGRKSQGARTRALADFKKGDVRVLVATDIAARGLDIDRLPHVVNFELPNVPEDYVHRIGRTARAGHDGHAVSLVCIDEKKLLADIETLLKKPIERVVIEGFEPDPNAKPAPAKGRNGQRPPRGGRPGGGPGARHRGQPRSQRNKGRGRSSRGAGSR